MRTKKIGGGIAVSLDELEALLLEHEDGALDDAGVKRLRALLDSSEEARQFFVQHRMIQAAFHLDQEAGLIEGNPTPVHAANNNHSSRESTEQTSSGNRWWIAASILVVATLAGRLLQLEFFSERGPSLVSKSTNDDKAERAADEEATAQGVALLTQLVDVGWHEGQTQLEVGEALPKGKFQIDSGFAQIEFFSGATVILEGPAELELLSASAAKVQHGRLRTLVPPAARGFSLEVKDLKVVDLGTEFGLAVSDEGADVQVFDGEVELLPRVSQRQLLTEGQAVTLSEGSLEPAAVSPNQFVNLSDLESRLAGQSDQRWERWRDWSMDLRRDPRLIAYYAFDEPEAWHRRLGSSLDGTGELDGAIVGARRVRGRWTSKGALEFKQPGDRVRIQIPGQFASLSFSCWVKIDSLDRWYNSLFLTDHYDQGEPHWQILDSGQLFFSVRHKADDVQGEAAKKRTHQPILSPPFWKPSMSGRWLHLATTYDAESGQTRHYLNGKVLHEELIAEEFRVPQTRIGAASVGNWSIPTKDDAEFAIRNLNGSIDEFAIFAAALTADEVREMYDRGKP